MSRYIKEWPCCGDETKTDAWIPESCPFCGLLAAEHENEQLRARVAELEDLIRYAQVESGVCMCGEDIQTHNQVSGHSPVDIWDHARGAVLESSTSKPFILHKQAEAVTHCLHRLRLATTADGCRNHIESEVRRLLGEAENAGGDR